MWNIVFTSVWALATAASSMNTRLGVHFPNSTSALPTLTLPYGTWRASAYDTAKDIYTFRNIRFAAPPVGNLRWAKPAAPAYNATIQDGSYGNVCPQGYYNKGAEDCLFIDLYAPGAAIRNLDQKLPVVVWTYGGSNVIGYKDSYSGVGPVSGSGNKMIFVAYNYRLGSFGFLAGSTMEQQGLPNAAFYDQRAAFQWVQDYIHLVGGHKDYVTAWGESAGAGAIVHHITAFGGKQDPLFRQVVLQSIASEPLADRRGQVEGFYQEFLARANCSGQSLACLRSAAFEILNAANLALIFNAPSSAFKPGPSPDGTWMRQEPALELASGNFFKNISGLMLSHVAHEGDMFATGTITSDAAFVSLTNFIIPAYAPSVRKAVADYYPSPNSAGGPYRTQDARAIQYSDDTVFMCNYRYLNAAFQNKTWSMQYSVYPGLHANDLTPAFFNDENYGAGAITAEQATLFRNYQDYLTLFSITGVPNSERIEGAPLSKIYWPKTTGQQDETLSNVLNVTGNGFEIITDQESLKSRCDFFLNVQAAVTLAGGYVPPGGAVPNNLGVTNSDPSGNYTTPSVLCGSQACKAPRT